MTTATAGPRRRGLVGRPGRARVVGAGTPAPTVLHPLSPNKRRRGEAVAAAAYCLVPAPTSVGPDGRIPVPSHPPLSPPPSPPRIPPPHPHSPSPGLCFIPVTAICWGKGGGGVVVPETWPSSPPPPRSPCQMRPDSDDVPPPPTRDPFGRPPLSTRRPANRIAPCCAHRTAADSEAMRGLPHGRGRRRRRAAGRLQGGLVLTPPDPHPPPPPHLTSAPPALCVPEPSSHPPPDGSTLRGRCRLGGLTRACRRRPPLLPSPSPHPYSSY